MIKHRVFPFGRLLLAACSAFVLSQAAYAGDGIKGGVSPSSLTHAAGSRAGTTPPVRLQLASADIKPVTSEQASQNSLPGYIPSGDRLLTGARLLDGKGRDISLPQLAREELRQAPSTGLLRLAAWQRYAMPFKVAADRPQIVVVMDDLGLKPDETLRLIDFSVPLTLSFLPYAPDLPAMTRLARARGHELLVHMPMEPIGHEDPGPNALKTSLSQEEIHTRLVWALSQFGGFVGINNHMGSKFTQYAPGLQTVMTTLHARGLMFLDSMTGPSIAYHQAAAAHVPWLKRDVFIDHYMDEASVKFYLKRLEETGTSQGFAIGIGHPHPVTMRVLESWVKDVEARGFQIVPLTAVMKEREGLQMNVQGPSSNGIL